MPISNNLLLELRTEISELRAVLLEALADFALYQEGLLRLHQEQLKAIGFHRKRTMAVGLVILVIVLFGTAQAFSSRRISAQNNKLLETIDCVVKVAAEVPQELQPAAYGECRHREAK